MTSHQNIRQLFAEAEASMNSIYNDPSLYINRELSWIEFNKRVLHQTARKDVPLLERMRFLGITSSNLDEFIMVRLSSVLNKQRKAPLTTDIAGMLPTEEYDELFDEIVQMKESMDLVYSALKKKMKNHGMVITRVEQLNDKEKAQVTKLFTKQIYPLLTPISVDTSKDFPLIRSKQLTLVVGLEDKKNPNLNVICVIPVETGLQRIYPISAEKGQTKYVFLEDIIFENLNELFMQKEIVYKGCIRIVREADIELEANPDIFIVDRMKQTLRKREFSKPIFMDVTSGIPKQAIKLLTKMFDIDKSRIYKSKSILDYSAFISSPIKNLRYEYESFDPQYPEELIGEHDMFSAMDSNDILLHHPYESFEPVVQFLEQAAEDKNVLSIKQTLYRVASSDSPIVEALCRAAQLGKQVSVMLEIKARFDEERNISLIDKLKLAGCKVLYGIEGLKTHAKCIVVVKKTSKGLKTYCHIGTGNYNNKTSKIYTDLSYFTSNSKIGQDILTVFNILSGFSEPQDTINKILYAPFNIRSKLYDLIDREIQNVADGGKGFITLKLNSLSDKGIIKRLYEASEAGVKVTIFARGICSMKPINKNISITSIVGRFLEHSRIYYFHNNGKIEIFISSADLLTRNLDRRVEIMVPITEPDIQEKLFSILSMYYNDTFNAYRMNKKGNYTLVDKHFNINIHEDFMVQAISNYKLRNVPKMNVKQKK